MSEKLDNFRKTLGAVTWFIFGVAFLILVIAACYYKFNFSYSTSKNFEFTKDMFNRQKEEVKAVRNYYQEEVQGMQKFIFNNPTIPWDIKDSVLHLINSRKADIADANFFLSKFEVVQSDEDKSTLMVNVMDHFSFKSNREKLRSRIDLAENMINKRKVQETADELMKTKEELKNLNSQLQNVLSSSRKDKKDLQDLRESIRKSEIRNDSLQQVLANLAMKISGLENDVGVLENDKTNLRDTLNKQIPFRIENCTFRAMDCKSRKTGAYKQRCIDTLVINFKLTPENGKIFQEFPLIISLSHTGDKVTPFKTREIKVLTGEYINVYFTKNEVGEFTSGLYTANIIFNHRGKNISLTKLLLTVKKGLL